MKKFKLMKLRIVSNKVGLLVKGKILFCLSVLCFIFSSAFARVPVINVNEVKLLNIALVNRFYQLNHDSVFWFTSPASSSYIREQFLQILDSAIYDGLNKDRYHYSYIRKSLPNNDSFVTMEFDRVFTDAVISYCKDMYAGADISQWIRSDEVSHKYLNADNDYLLRNIVDFEPTSGFGKILSSIEPKQKQYSILRDELKRQIYAGNTVKIGQLKASVNLYRWIHHFRFDRFIVVNIPSATLRYTERDSMKLQMKVVVGKPSTRSPRFSTWCSQVVLYPYWNVPRSIGLKELLPRFKRSPASLTEMNMQVIGRNGKIIDHTRIDWSIYNRSNFPYTFRQCTGCDNSLGVVKFNLTDPFGVYMHDTNFKLAFLKDTRFLSHGCIRVEKPIELANCLLDNQLDSNFLKACLKDQVPILLNINDKVPVFVVYMTAEPDVDSVVFRKDIYHLF